MWCDFLRVFNGRQLFLSTQRAAVTADACPQAAGAFFEADWLYHNFGCDSPTLSALHINHKETIAVCLAAKCWSSQWASKQVVVHSDNQAAVGMMNKGSTGNSIVMEALRRLFWLSATFNFRLVARYIPGSSNGVADAFSRLNSPSHLLYAWQVLRTIWGVPALLSMDPLINHMLYASSLFLSCRYGLSALNKGAQ